MKPEILVLVPIYAPALAALEREFTVHRLWTAKDPDGLLQEVSGRVRGAVTTGSAGFTRAQVAALPKLEIVSAFGVGRRTLDLAAAKERGIVVTNAPDTHTDSVADLAVGLMIAVMRRIGETERFVRAGRWPHEPPPLGRELGGKTCGIVGLGEIGRRIAKRVAAFGMSVRYHGPREKPGAGYPYDADLKNLAQAADCLVVCCPLTPATRNLVDARILDALGPEGFLVNVARGPIVEQGALITALRERRIAGAGLDVYWDEPHVPEALTRMEHVVLVPHIGSSTREIREARTAKLLANLRAHFGGKPVPNPVTGES